MRRFLRFWLTGMFIGAFFCSTVNANPSFAEVAVTPDVNIHVLDSGPSNTAQLTLIFVPGWRFTTSIWSAQIDAFARDRRVIAIDPRSQGDSTKAADGNTPEIRAQDLHAVLEKLNVGRRVVVGWSQGVQDVAAYVERYGTANIDGIILVDSTISGGAATISKAPAVAAQELGLLQILAASPRDYTIGMMRAVISRPLSPSELNSLVDSALKTPTAIGVAMLVADLFGTDRTPSIAKFDKPVLIIASPRSPELADQKAMAAKLPNAHLRTIDNAGHAVFVDQPQRFNALVQDFLNKLPKPGK